MPGRIIQSLKKAGTSIQFCFDEIDKLSYSNQVILLCFIRGLDPEQNNSLLRYLEMGYDLSKVMFIATSNNMAIQPAAETVWKSSKCQLYN
jgi:ATP-dependent Lon protease